MITELDSYLLNHILSYCNIIDICELLCVSKTISIARMALPGITIHGYFVYELVQFFRKHQIVSISYLKIENYNMANDHCMWKYNSECRCIQEIIDTFQHLQIGNLEMKNVYFRQHVPLHVERLYLIDSTFEVDIINSIKNLKALVINSNFEYYYPDAYWNEEIQFNGLELQCIEYFECNGFVFEDQLLNFIENSQRVDSLKVFRIQTLMDEENDYSIIIGKMKEKFKNAKLEVYL